MKRVIGFQSEDNEIHKTALEAHTADFNIAVLGIMNRNSIGKGAAPIMPRDVAQFVVGHASEIYPAMQKYRAQVRQSQKTEKKVASA